MAITFFQEQIHQSNQFKHQFQEWRKLISASEIDDERLESLVHGSLSSDIKIRENSINFMRNVFQNKLSLITNQENKVNSRGDVECIIEYKDGSTEDFDLRNTLLRDGKVALAKVLTNDVNDPFDFYISSIVFGTNGTSTGTPKFVDETRSGLFGTTLLTKNVISSIDESAPTTAILTSVVKFDEAVGYALNEMALKMANGDLYSMVTFPDLNKTSQIQLTFNWRISLL